MARSAIRNAVGIGGLGACLLLPVAGWAQEPAGFRDRGWGTPWNSATINSLPGCETQGDLVTDVDGLIARVAQPECVGYRFSEHQRVNLILFYPDTKWHSLDRSRSVVDSLLALRRLWGLKRDTAARLEQVSAELARLAPLRRLYGAGEPAFPDAGDVFRLPDHVQGLQGYQINFPRPQYDSMRSALLDQLGPPPRRARPSSGTGSFPPAVGGEALEWVGDRTLVVLQERGGLDGSGYFAVLTTGYLGFLAERARVAAPPPRPWARDDAFPRPSAASYTWFLEIVESFEWLVHP